ncbi:Structural maintenance of chromosomes flexible hinge domain-containing protein 1 [Nymphon striatum]|nr:Structural maintenance of chromosomes flexible hinge domain-containing protein 1 [Nymphon striatum]
MVLWQAGGRVHSTECSASLSLSPISHTAVKNRSELEGGETLYILNNVNQDLPAPTELEISFIPHYDTIVKSGMYEYYASQGQNPLPFAFAELVDNSLAATAGNGGERRIELRLMITKKADVKDVHELCISKEEFEKRERITNLFIPPGDVSHISDDDDYLKKVIFEETKKDNFTCVVINGIAPNHIQNAKQNYKIWCQQLAHIYHYYVHGAEGNFINEEGIREVACEDTKIDIEVNLYIRGILFRTTNLIGVIDDIPTLYNSSAASTFEFRATVEGTKVVDGLMRYHPFLYDHETFPVDNTVLDSGEDHDYGLPNADGRPARGKRAIFECYWNGRLIPYTCIEEFDWCAVPKKSRSLPLECFNRVSGVLWANEQFQVSTNKLTFMDLEGKLRDKNTVFSKVVGGQERRGNIDKHFLDWLKECHEICDKQILFSNFHGIVSRPDLHRVKQYPWAEYYRIEWDGKSFRKGQLVKTIRCQGVGSNMCGTVNRFLLYGDHEGETYATGGEVEVIQEPRSIHDNVIKTFPLLKLDRSASTYTINAMITEEEEKLVGAIKVEIANHRGDLISKIAGSSQKKLLVELRINWHSSNSDVIVVQHISQHAKNWPYWFRKMENLKNLGPHSLILQAVLNESGATNLCGKVLPSTKINFTITEAAPEKFTVGVLDGPFRVGLPFSIPLEFQDKFGNPTKPTPDLHPSLIAPGLILDCGSVICKGSALYIQDIIAEGTVDTNTGKNFGLTVTIPELDPSQSTQSLKIRLLPGPPHSINFGHYSEAIENGSAPEYNFEVVDGAGNPTTEHRASITCKFSTTSTDYLESDFPIYSADLSKSSQFTLTGDPITLQQLKEPINLKAEFTISVLKSAPPICKDLSVIPSKRVTRINLSYINEKGNRIEVDRGKDILMEAGSILKGLEIKVLDEGGKEVELDESLMSRLKLNWVSSSGQKMSVTPSRMLPNIKVSTTAKNSQYCHISLSTESALVDFDFTIRTKSGPVTQIKAKITGEDKVKMGDRLPSNIHVTLQDQYGNNVQKTKKLAMDDLRDLTIISEHLEYSKLEKALEQNFGFIFTGLHFKNSAPIGKHELCVKWQELSDYVRIEITAGTPASISYIGINAENPVTVYNEKYLDEPLMVQLCDNSGNKCEDSNIKVQLISDDNLKLMPAPHILRTTNQGQANFGIFSLAVKNNALNDTCPAGLCKSSTKRCRGTFTMYAKAFYGRTVITGSTITFHMPCDPNHPTFLDVEYDKDIAYVAGQCLQEFKISVKGEDGSFVKTVERNQMSMKLWRGPKGMENPIVCGPSTSKKADSPRYFYFRENVSLTVAGLYHVKFTYSDASSPLSSETVTLEISPGSPVKMLPIQDPGAPVVSNTVNQSRRCLVRYLKMRLLDEYDNVIDSEESGHLVLKIVCPKRPPVPANRIPRFIGNVTALEIPITKSQVILQNILIQENSPGIDGKEYILRCIPSIRAIKATLSPYEISFLFYNDVEKQEKMLNLSTQRDQLKRLVEGYRGVFSTFNELSSTLQKSLLNITREVSSLKKTLNVKGDLSAIQELIKKEQTELKTILSQPRRSCQLAPAPDEEGVLGKVGFLGLVKEATGAHVLSWHMASDMDCIVTHSIDKARELYFRYGNKYQVLALNTIYKKNLPDWSKPLPHTRIKNLIPSGNPVYARDLLIFPKEPENCKLLFGMLLGDTIILDTIDDATKYREEIQFDKVNLHKHSLDTIIGGGALWVPSPPGYYVSKVGGEGDYFTIAKRLASAEILDNEIGSLSDFGFGSSATASTSGEVKKVTAMFTSETDLIVSPPLEDAAAAPKVPGSVKSFLIKDDVLRAEILWTLKAVTSHMSFSSSKNMSELLPKMFPDSEIAKQFQCGERKMAYVCVYGLAEFFKKLLNESIKGQFVVLFDESLNKKMQEKQMDVHARYIDEANEVKTRYFGSTFLGHGTANDLMDHFTKSVLESGLPVKNMIQVSMDGPNVNWKFYGNLKKKLNDEYGTSLINIGSCGLHIVHNSFKRGMDATGWKVASFLSSLYYLFKDAPARKEDYVNVTSATLMPLKFVKHRWLENVPVCQRALDTWDSIVKFVKATQSGQLNKPNNKSYEIVKECVNDKCFLAKLHFFKCIASLLQPFLKKYQTDKPMMPFISDDLCMIIRTLMRRFIKNEYLECSNEKLIKIDVSDKNLQVNYKKIDIGYASEKLKNVKPSEREILEFRMECKACLVDLLKKLLEKCPATYSLVRHLSCLNPVNMASDKEVCSAKFKKVLMLLLSSGRISEKDCDPLLQEYGLFLDNIPVFGTIKFSNFDNSTNRLDSLFFEYMSGPNYIQLLSVVKLILVMSHGQASVERGFNINKEIEVENMKEHTLVARRMVCDHVNTVKGVTSVDINKSLLLSVKHSRKKYEQYLEQQRVNKKSDDLRAKRKSTLEEIEEIKKKKRRLDADIKCLNETADQLLQKAEDEGKLSHLTKANSFRRTAKDKMQQLLVKHTYCPTLLTRTGDRVRSNGKFGGSQNKALPVERLRGVIFGEPTSVKLEEMNYHIDQLKNLEVALMKEEQVKQELVDHKMKEDEEEIQVQKKEWEAAEVKLMEIEKELGVSTVPPSKDGSNSKLESTSKTPFPSKVGRKKIDNQTPQKKSPDPSENSLRTSPRRSRKYSRSSSSPSTYMKRQKFN